jgi:hypothetical protein
MKTMMISKMDVVKKGVESVLLSNDTNKSISNFRETIPLNLRHAYYLTLGFRGDDNCFELTNIFKLNH